ncbi:hypothetical protein SAMN04488494_0595 [Xylanibacter ruminicola]|uniref:Uncharacterized protein n=2 Tax=Xylanibacter ruminicola TaxID=839 RepID=A0A1M7D1B0_XYLRU|nr:hypothetical protein SAMN04488494_0595 [Xylanibacter ruminicola]
MLLASVAVNAQRIDKPNEPYYIYCGIDIQTDVQIVIGEDEYVFNIIDNNGEKLKIEKPANIRTYMSKRGWDYVEKSGPYSYVFRKKVLSDDEAFSDFKLMYKTGKDKGKIREEKIIR